MCFNVLVESLMKYSLKDFADCDQKTDGSVTFREKMVSTVFWCHNFDMLSDARKVIV